jgi:hypothetical protein
MGREVAILPNKEDFFSGLQDEIYKTVTTLYKTREEAVVVKENYADNLANIAHQMKTPLTSMSLMTQLLKSDLKEEYVEQFQKQLERLTKLEEALLLLSRIDVGVLELEKEMEYAKSNAKWMCGSQKLTSNGGLFCSLILLSFCYICNKSKLYKSNGISGKHANSSSFDIRRYDNGLCSIGIFNWRKKNL